MSNVVLFDAVGTIIETVPSVIDVYFDHGRQQGSRLSRVEISERFKSARRRLFDLDASAAEQQSGQLRSSDVIERALWRQLIEEIFEDVRPIDDLFDSLWDFFANPENWRLYDDTPECFRHFKAEGYAIGIASNFDSRLLDIVNSFEALRTVDFVFSSADIGFRKPDPAFYAAVEQRIVSKFGLEEGRQYWMTGDCIENDFHGPCRHGWNAIWLDRRNAIAAQEPHRIGSLSDWIPPSIQ